MKRKRLYLLPLSPDEGKLRCPCCAQSRLFFPKISCSKPCLLRTANVAGGCCTRGLGQKKAWLATAWKSVCPFSSPCVTVNGEIAGVFFPPTFRSSRDMCLS